MAGIVLQLVVLQQPLKRLTNSFYYNRTDAYCTVCLLYRIDVYIY